MRLLIAMVAFGAGIASAQPQCQFYLADQTAENAGFALHLQGQADSKGSCSLNSVNLVLTVGDGTRYRRITATHAWQTGVVYTAKAVVATGGMQQLSLDGKLIASGQDAFKPAPGTVFGSEISSTQGASAAYLVTQIWLDVANGATDVSIAPNGVDPVPLPLILMAAGGTLWPAPFAMDPTHTTTITATFRFDAAVADPHQFDPYIDGYGQTTFSAWPAKVASDSDLQAAIAEEQAWLEQNPPPGGMDIYGGSLLAGWTDTATNYYHKAFYNNRWWLISPLGNPMFYIGLTGIYEDSTPITEREGMFSNLPDPEGPLAPAYAHNLYGDAKDTTYLSFATANLIRKYGTGWRSAKNDSTLARISSWGFAGSGKWTHPGPELLTPVNPVLNHNGVPDVVAGGHPDIFDTKVMSQLASSLGAQIGANLTNPYIIGWSVGNEKNEIIGAHEVEAMLGLGAGVPAKRNLVDHALSAIYGGSLSALAMAWNVKATTIAEAYAAKPTLFPDTEALRLFYEQSYYAALYQTVKSIDPNHLYLGSWILPREFSTDFPVAAANCDVIGMDLYAPTFSEPIVTALINAANKPVLIGEFSYPAAYAGLRGFGSDQYGGEITLSDSASGDSYAQWLSDTSANPNIVGVEWFDYRDEPVSGRGNNDGVGNISPSLVIGENFAFGMVDVTDRPKYDLVNKARAANVATLQSLGLLGPAAAPQSGPQ